VQNIDKIAIGAAVVLLLVGFASSAFIGDQGAEFSDAISTATGEIQSTQAKQSVVNQAAPEVENEVK
jgi:hypothetical protein